MPPPTKDKQSELFGEPDKKDVVAAEVQAEAPKVEAKVEEPPEPEPQVDDAAEELNRQIATLRETARSEKERGDREAAARADAMRRAQQMQQQNVQLQQDSLSSRLLAVNNAIAAAQAEADRAQGDLVTSGTNQDFTALAEAQRRLARAEANLATLENGKSQLEEEVTRQRALAQQQAQQAQQQQQQRQQGDQLDQTNLPDTAKKWLRAHPDYLNDQRKNAKIQSLHWDVLDEGHSPFTDAYFESLERHLGLRPNIMSGTNREQPQQQVQQERSVPVSAPVTREVPNANGQRNTSQVRLSAAEREAAKNAGVTEAEYAKQKQRMLQAKQEGLLQ